MMLGEKKAPLKGKSRRQKVVLEGFSAGDGLARGGLRGKKTYNCDCRGGRIRRGVGLAEKRTEEGRRILVAIAEEVTNVFLTWLSVAGGEDERGAFLIGESGYLYQLNLNTSRTAKRGLLGEDVVYCAVKDETGGIQHVFSGGNGTAYTIDGANFLTLVEGGTKGACTVGGRLFLGFDSRTVKYTAPYDLSELGGNSDEGGEIYLPVGEGEILSLQTDGEAVYAFTLRDIYRLVPAAKSEDFLMEKVAYEGDEICCGAFVSMGKAIIFLAKDGAYRLVGKSAERICAHLQIQPNDANFRCRAGYCGDLALLDYQTVDEGGELVERRVAIASDGKDGFFCERYGTLGGGELCVDAGIVYRFEQDAAAGEYLTMPYFQTEDLDFGTSKRKFLKKLRVEGRGSVRVKVRCQGKTKTYAFDLKNGGAEARLTERGRTFSFYIFPEAKSEAARLTVEYETEV